MHEHTSDSSAVRFAVGLLSRGEVFASPLREGKRLERKRNVLFIQPSGVSETPHSILSPVSILPLLPMRHRQAFQEVSQYLVAALFEVS